MKQSSAKRRLQSVFSALIGAHLIGAAISFTYFSYQYAREHGFLRWLLFGEIVPALRSLVWEVFVIIALISPAPQTVAQDSDFPVPLVAQAFWWQNEFPELLVRLAKAPGRELKTSFSVRDNKQVNLTLRQLENKSILLVFDAPGESLVEADPSGRLLRGSGRNITRITDSDRDGQPDVFTYGPNLENQSAPVRIARGDHQAILAMWGIGIGYSVNWFIHGIGSATPRR